MINVYYNNVLHKEFDDYNIEYSRLHREGDLPAIIWKDGSKSWCKNGQPHRDGDLPAIIHENESKHWYKNGQLHREGDEPAIIYADGRKYWLKNDKCYINFNLSSLIFLQLFLIFTFNNQKNKQAFHPDNLIGKMIKNEIFNFLNRKRKK